MKRNTALKLLNPVLAYLAASQVLTGLLHGLLPRDLFFLMHRAGGLSLAFVALLHVALNWNWVKANYFAGKPPEAAHTLR